MFPSFFYLKKTVLNLLNLCLLLGKTFNFLFFSSTMKRTLKKEQLNGKKKIMDKTTKTFTTKRW